MRIFVTISAVFLFFFLVVSVPAFSQEPDHQAQTQDDKAKSKDDKAAKPDDRGVKQDEGKKDENKRDEARPDVKKTGPAHSGTAQPNEVARPDRRQEDHAIDRQQRPVAAQQNNQRIPEDQFRAHFGREHHFHVDRTRVVNQSQPVVVYEGYSFQLVDPWPAEWSYDDDCYIDYVDDGYYLFDVAHPGIRIAVVIMG